MEPWRVGASDSDPNFRVLVFEGDLERARRVLKTLDLD